MILLLLFLLVMLVVFWKITYYLAKIVLALVWGLVRLLWLAAKLAMV
jgi:hypothetical protein